MKLRFVHGAMGDFLSLVGEAARWLIDIEQPMWIPEEILPETFAKLPTDAIVVAYDGEIPVAAMTLTFEDRLFWPEISANESGFIHKLCVARSHAGRGLPAEMVGYAKRVCLSKGIEMLRLDADAFRPKLLALYEGLGFKSVCTRNMGAFSVVLYKMRIVKEG